MLFAAFRNDPLKHFKLADQSLTTANPLEIEYFLFIDGGGTKIEFEPLIRVSWEEKSSLYHKFLPVTFYLKNDGDLLASIISRHTGNLISLNDDSLSGVDGLADLTHNLAKHFFPAVEPANINILFSMAGAANIFNPLISFEIVRKKAGLLERSMVKYGYNHEKIKITGDSLNLLNSFTPYLQIAVANGTKVTDQQRTAIEEGPLTVGIYIGGTGSVTIAKHYPHGISEEPLTDFFWNGGHGPVLADKGSGTEIGKQGIEIAIERGDNIDSKSTLLTEYFFKRFHRLLPEYSILLDEHADSAIKKSVQEEEQRDLRRILEILYSNGDLHNDICRFHPLFGGKENVEVTTLYGMFTADVIESALVRKDHSARHILNQAAYDATKYILGAINKIPHSSYFDDQWGAHQVVIGYHGGIFKNPGAEEFFTTHILDGENSKNYLTHIGKFERPFPGVRGEFSNVLLLPFGLGEKSFQLAHFSIEGLFPKGDSQLLA
jgi:hypothetical protein